MQEIGVKKAALYNAIAKYSTMFVQLGVTMMLSRLIIPEAFGVVAITSVLLGFLSLFADLGLGVSIIQHPEMSENEINRLFSFSITIGLFLGALTVLAAFPLTSIYNNPLYRELCFVLSLVSFLQAANVVPSSILIRDKRFKTIAARTILSSIISGVIAVIMAWKEYGVYALVFQSIINYAVLFVWNYCNLRLSFVGFRYRTIASLLGTYSLFQVLFNFLNFFTRNLDNLVIGKCFGSAPLAQYNKSYMLYLYPNNLFSAVLTGVIHPYIREYKNDNLNMFDKYLKIEKVLSLIGIFTMIVFFSCSHEIVYIMFGSNWQPAGTYLRCLSLCMWTQMMSATSGSIFLGLERTDQVFKCGIINLLFILISIFVGICYNSLFVLSLCVSISYNVIFLVTNYILVKKTMGINLRTFLTPFMWDCIFAFSFIILIYILPVFENVFASLIIKSLICTVAYALFLSLTKQWKTILSLKGMMK